jgi:hypothetical protein
LRRHQVHLATAPHRACIDTEGRPG